ncbi:hypothetical protein GEK60_22815 [Salmonella enterica]|nr:hypothetical protein [Salmonella enterica]EDI7846559.1 hypothetical protein [Salmonella enterica]EEA1030192.1 hypothetical protein [Salmonella enterica]
MMVEKEKSAGWSLADFRHHCAQYGMHKAPSDWRLHNMKYTPVGVDIAKHMIQVHLINEHTVTNGAKVGLPQLGWRFSCQRTHHPSSQ